MERSVVSQKTAMGLLVGAGSVTTTVSANAFMVDTHSEQGLFHHEKKILSRKQRGMTIEEDAFFYASAVYLSGGQSVHIRRVTGETPSHRGCLAKESPGVVRGGGIGSTGGRDRWIGGFCAIVRNTRNTMLRRALPAGGCFDRLQRRLQTTRGGDRSFPVFQYKVLENNHG